MVTLRPQQTNFRPSVHPSTSVHIFKFLMGPRPNPSKGWMLHRRKSVQSSTSNDNLGPVSESVHEMDDLSPNFVPLSTWIGPRRPDNPKYHSFSLEFPLNLLLENLLLKPQNISNMGETLVLALIQC